MVEIQAELIYSADAADLLRVSVRTIHRMVADGRLTPIARGRGPTGSIVFRREDVTRYIVAVEAGAA